MAEKQNRIKTGYLLLEFNENVLILLNGATCTKTNTFCEIRVVRNKQSQSKRNEAETASLCKNFDTNEGVIV